MNLEHKHVQRLWRLFAGTMLCLGFIASVFSDSQTAIVIMLGSISAGVISLGKERP